MCLHCGSRRIRRSGHPYGPWIALLGLVAERCQDCQRRFPLRRGTARSTLAIESSLSAASSEAIELILRDALGGVPGSWEVKIAPAPADGRWCVTIEGTRTAMPIRLSLPPTEHAPQVLGARVVEALEYEGLA